MAALTHLRIDSRHGWPRHVWQCPDCGGLSALPSDVADVRGDEVRCDTCQDKREVFDDECDCSDCEVMAHNAEMERVASHG